MRRAVLASVTAAVAASVDAFAAPPVSIADARLRVRLPAAGDVALLNHGARSLALIGAASPSAATA